MEAPHTARIIKVADAKGRKHECILKIYIWMGKHWVWNVGSFFKSNYR
jgi:hypothetical protein